MTKPLNTQLSQREAPQPRSARRPRTWLVALLGFGAADLLVLNLWAVPKLITNTTTTDMRAAHSGEAQGAAAEPELQPQPSQPAQGMRQGESPSEYRAAQPADTEAQLAAQAAQQRGAEQDDSAAQIAAVQDDGVAQRGVAQPTAAAHQDDTTSSRGARAPQRRAAGRADSATGEGAAASPGDQAAEEGAAPAQQRGATTRPSDSAQSTQGSGAARPGDSAAQPAQPGDSAAQAELQRGAAARSSDSAQSAQESEAARPGENGSAAQAELQRAAARPDETAAQAPQRAAANPQGDVAAPDGVQVAAAQEAKLAGQQAAAARADWTAQAPRAEAPPGGAPPASQEIADLPSDPTVARAFAVRAAQRAVRVALTDRNAFPDNGPFDALTVADQPLAQIFFSMGNFTLGPNGKQMLERKLPQLISDQRPILIVGAADPSGPEQVNEKLSDARAQSVAEWLLAHGVDAQRIQTHAIGHEGAVGSTLDRRVDIWLGGSR